MTKSIHEMSDFEKFNELMTDDNIQEIIGKAKPCPFCNGLAFEMIDVEGDYGVVTFHQATCILAERDEYRKINKQTGFVCAVKYFFSKAHRWNERAVD